MQHSDALSVAGHVNPGAIDCVGRSVCWPDRESPFIPVVGVNVVNEFPPTGIFRTAHVPQTVDLQAS